MLRSHRLREVRNGICADDKLERYSLLEAQVEEWGESREINAPPLEGGFGVSGFAGRIVKRNNFQP